MKFSHLHPEKKFSTIKITYNEIDEIWSVDLDDMIEYKTSYNRGYR